MPNAISDKTRKRLRHLKNLAMKGDGGEAVNAGKILQQMLKKYNLSESDIGMDAKATRFFTAKKTFHKQVLLRTIDNVCNDIVDVFSSNKNRTKIEVNLTDYEYAQITIRYDAYRKDIKSMEDEMENAFILKNNLLTKTELNMDDVDDRELTDSDRERRKRLLTLQRGMKTTIIPNNLLPTP